MKKFTQIKCVTIFLLIAMLLVACNSGTTPESEETVQATEAPAAEAESSDAAEPTEVVEEEMVEEEVVEEETAEEATTEEEMAEEEMTEEESSDEAMSSGGGRVVVLLSEDLEVMNPYITTAFITGQVTEAVIEPLVQPDADGEYQPVLAARVPTEASGDVTNDGRTITWQLKEGVTWSDGSPFTSADVLFTYEAAVNADSGSVRTSSFAGIESIEAPDDYTVVITYAEFNSSFLDQFQWGILPASAGEAADMLSWDYNRQPLGTGPFKVDEWISGDRIVMSRNENYREEGQPHLDELIFQIVPSEEVRVQMMLEGDAQIMMWPDSTLREVWDGADNVQLQLAPGIYVLRMFLNLSQPGDGDPGAAAPHPILGDPAVRQAIALAIDYDSIVNDLAEGRVDRATSPFALGWYDCGIAGDPYDPEAAAALLDEAGWRDEDGDGIREAHDNMYAEEGTPLSLTMTGYSGFTLLDQTELVIAEYLKDIGVDLQVGNEEMAVLFGGWADQAPRKVGDYDILIYDTGAGINPQQHIADYFLSYNIPTEENGGVGANYTRWVNEDADALIEEAGRTPDLAERKELYCQLGELIKESYSQIFLYQFQEGHAFSTSLAGVQVSTWAPLTWDAEHWELSQ
jgi:peptide/nickel transport system substrate-binding protein